MSRKAYFVPKVPSKLGRSRRIRNVLLPSIESPRKKRPSTWRLARMRSWKPRSALVIEKPPGPAARVGVLLATVAAA
jgi:hypothetical protein